MDRLGAVAFGLLLLAPLAAPPGFATEAPRLAVVLGLLAVLLAAAAIRRVREREGRLRSDPLRTAAVLLLGIHLLSFAAGPPTWEGALPLAILASGVAVYALAGGETLRREYLLDRGLPVLSALGLAVSATGLVQAGLGRPAVSTEGNTNYSGTLAAMLLPVAVSAVRASSSPGGRFFHALSAAALAGLLWASGSRGGLAGAVAGCLVAGMSPGTGGGRRAAAAAAGLAVLLVAVPLGFRGARYLSRERMDTGRVRLGIWKGTAGLIGEHPVLGVGPGNFAARFPPHRDPQEFLLSCRPVWPDHREVEDAHSTWMQMAAETGGAGLLAFLLVLYVAVRLWRYYLRTAPGPRPAAALSGLGGGAAAYLVSGLFNTLTLRVSHTLLFWAFLGLIERTGRIRERRQYVPPGSAAALAAALSVLSLAGAGMAGILSWMDRRFESGMRVASPAGRAALFEEALRVHPPCWLMRYELARARAAQGFFRQSAAEYRRVLESRPHHVGALNNLAVSLLEIPGGEEEADRHLRHAAEVAPCYYLTHYNRGTLEARRGRLPEARAAFAEAFRWNPNHARSCYSLGIAFLVEGEAERAREWFLRARDLGLDVASLLRREHPGAVGDPRLAELFR